MCHHKEIKFCHFETPYVWHCLQSLSQWTSWSMKTADHPPHFNVLNADHPPKLKAQWLHRVSTVWFIYTSRFDGFWSTPRFVLCTLPCWGWRGQKGQHICLQHTSKPSAPSAHVGLCARALHHLSTQLADVKTLFSICWICVDLDNQPISHTERSLERQHQNMPFPNSVVGYCSREGDRKGKIFLDKLL